MWKVLVLLQQVDLDLLLECIDLQDLFGTKMYIYCITAIYFYIP